ncbi:PfkB family carbohydrate kinase [Pedobacter paludis]|uniref:Nucleoside 2-deoxyribosyltransferase n=1 Tax=Pedobacter paludis TaxID=2203212 RepID=A0A317F5I6_9SPHI|nr:PfkB family carbohydrate kinase [Pedobacter paludis]PWS33307.1 nucleoside 2-deoxyribosyltransferase [Pedobacter paludis]
MLNIVGGCYIENCREPYFHELYGSGLRAVFALSELVKGMHFLTCCGADYQPSLQSICETLNLTSQVHQINETIAFNYDHPLSRPFAYPDLEMSMQVYLVKEKGNFLYYGMNEATFQVHGDYIVYDPQNWKNFAGTGSTANHLAIILNKKEASYFSEEAHTDDLLEMGKLLLNKENAEVIVIKNGSNGALVVEHGKATNIPVYETSSVWPIGSGDIFSAVFAWRWAVEKDSPAAAADWASRYTAFYCQTKSSILSKQIPDLNPLEHHGTKKIYLAGPFFSIGERWVVNEVRRLLLDFGNDVFSPLHDVGLGIDKSMVEQDIEGIKQADVLFAIVHGLDAGTFFEIGYAKSLGKKVVVFAESVSMEDMAMLSGTDCEITTDLSTAIYKASW